VEDTDDMAFPADLFGSQPELLLNLLRLPSMVSDPPQDIRAAPPSPASLASLGLETWVDMEDVPLADSFARLDRNISPAFFMPPPRSSPTSWAFMFNELEGARLAMTAEVVPGASGARKRPHVHMDVHQDQSYDIEDYLNQIAGLKRVMEGMARFIEAQAGKLEAKDEKINALEDTVQFLQDKEEKRRLWDPMWMVEYPDYIFEEPNSP
jgi:hypothetical protein